MSHARNEEERRARIASDRTKRLHHRAAQTATDMGMPVGTRFGFAKTIWLVVKVSRNGKRSIARALDQNPLQPPTTGFETVNSATARIEERAALPGRGAESDPKGAAGRKKPGFGNIPDAVMVLVNEVLRQGGVKYGPYNWADERMKASTYYDADRRHGARWWMREDTDGESTVMHHAHKIACSIIIIMQSLNGKLIDDRPTAIATTDYDVAAKMVAEARVAFAELRRTQGLPTGEE